MQQDSFVRSHADAGGKALLRLRERNTDGTILSIGLFARIAGQNRGAGGLEIRTRFNDHDLRISA